MDPATTVAARDGAAKAEQGAGQAKVPEDVRGFIKQLDDALLQGSSEAVTSIVERGNLRDFVRKVTASKPSIWNTEILRVETWDSEHVAVDAHVKVKIVGSEGSGRAIYILTRAGGKWKLSDVPVFDVK